MATTSAAVPKIHLIYSNIDTIRERFDKTDAKNKLYNLAVPLGRIIGREDFHEFKIVCATSNDITNQATLFSNEDSYQCLPRNLEVFVLDQCKTITALMRLIFSSSNINKLRTFIIKDGSTVEETNWNYDLSGKVENYRLPETVTTLISFDPSFSNLRGFIHTRNFRTIALGATCQSKMISGTYDNCHIIFAEDEPDEFNRVIAQFAKC